MRRQAVVMSSVSTRPKSRSTICGPRLGGVARTRTSSWPWRWRRRCYRFGKREDASGKDSAWFDTVLTDEVAHDPEVVAAVRARSLADVAVLDTIFATADGLNRAQQALVLARGIDDDAVLARVLTACGLAAAYNAELAEEYFAEAIELARALDDTMAALSEILTWRASAAVADGNAITVAAAKEGRDLAKAIGDGANSRHCQMCLGLAQVWQGDLAGAATQFASVATEAEAAHDGIHVVVSRAHQGTALALQGETDAARAAANVCLESASEFGALAVSIGYFALGMGGPGRRRR